MCTRLVRRRLMMAEVAGARSWLRPRGRPVHLACTQPGVHGVHRKGWRTAGVFAHAARRWGVAHGARISRTTPSCTLYRPGSNPGVPLWEDPPPVVAVRPRLKSLQSHKTISSEKPYWSQAHFQHQAEHKPPGPSALSRFRFLAACCHLGYGAATGCAGCAGCAEEPAAGGSAGCLCMSG